MAIGDESAQQTLDHGQKMQSLWLTMTQMGLVMQPSFAPICFDAYHRGEQLFDWQSDRLKLKAKKLSKDWQDLTHGQADYVIWAGRVGYAKGDIKTRSIRKSINELII